MLGEARYAIKAYEMSPLLLPVSTWERETVITNNVHQVKFLFERSGMITLRMHHVDGIQVCLGSRASNDAIE